MQIFARQDMPITFPGLFGGLEFNPDPVAINVGNGIYWYGIIICLGLLAAVVFCSRQAKKYGLTEDNVYDLIIWEIPLCVIGARAYYVLFKLSNYLNADGTLNWKRAIAVWDGGLAIYGGIIVAFTVLFIFCKIKKIPFGAFADLGVIGLLIGQSIGRWGNFINREAFGGTTTLPWRMGLWTTAGEYIEVHPTFLYESLWNFAGLMLILFVISKARTFDGENTCFYLIWYGIGRTLIEGLRTDSLYLFDLTLFGQPIRISQAVSTLLTVAGFILLFLMKRRHPRGQDALFVTRKAVINEAAGKDTVPAAEAESAAENFESTENASIEVPSENAEEVDSAEQSPNTDSENR